MIATSRAARITAVLSMLHEPPDRCSATRRFRDEPVLSWTLRRLARAASVNDIALLCWAEQKEIVSRIAGDHGASVFAPSLRQPMPLLDSISASRRWADGWRGGLLAACAFDRGYHPAWIAEILRSRQADSLLLADPAAGLIDPQLIDSLVRHADDNREVEFIFSPAAPGFSAVLLRADLVQRLEKIASPPGLLLAYQPALPARDPISTAACAATPTPIARTTERLTLDSDRQIERISRATAHLNGQLISTGAEEILQAITKTPPAAKLPRDLALELTAARATRPVFSPLRQHVIDRGEMPLPLAKKIIEALAGADDARLMLAGSGDPLLHPEVFEIIEYARSRGIGSIALETDLLQASASQIDRLAAGPVDLVLINIPAASARTYEAVMGVDGIRQVLANLKLLMERRQALARGTPIITPVFVKLSANLVEMEPWYDHWLRVLGSAVIAGPSGYAGQIPDPGAVQMEPPRRRPCARLASRLTILSDGKIVSCEQDFLGKQWLGNAETDDLSRVWTDQFAHLRSRHEQGKWHEQPLCAACREWHRP